MMLAIPTTDNVIMKMLIQRSYHIDGPVTGYRWTRTVSLSVSFICLEILSAVLMHTFLYLLTFSVWSLICSRVSMADRCTIHPQHLSNRSAGSTRLCMSHVSGERQLFRPVFCGQISLSLLQLRGLSSLLIGLERRQFAFLLICLTRFRRLEETLNSLNAQRVCSTGIRNVSGN